MVIVDRSAEIERGPEYVERVTRTRIGFTQSLRASGFLESEVIDLRAMRTLSIAVRCTYGAGPPSALRAHILTSADGDNWDTVDFTSFDVNVTASTAVQETQLIDTPEWGFLRVRVENLDASTAATNVAIFATRIKWSEEVTKFL